MHHEQQAYQMHATVGTKEQETKKSFMGADDGSRSDLWPLICCARKGGGYLLAIMACALCNSAFTLMSPGRSFHFLMMNPPDLLKQDQVAQWLLAFPGAEELFLAWKECPKQLWLKRRVLSLCVRTKPPLCHCSLPVGQGGNHSVLCKCHEGQQLQQQSTQATKTHLKVLAVSGCNSASFFSNSSHLLNIIKDLGQNWGGVEGIVRGDQSADFDFVLILSACCT